MVIYEMINFEIISVKQLLNKFGFTKNEHIEKRLFFLTRPRCYYAEPMI